MLGTTANGFPLPIPDQVRNFYQPNVRGVFTPTFVDYNYKSPYMIQYNASVQQQLPWNMALGVAYVGNRGVHLPTVRDGNPIFPTFLGPCGDPASLCVDGKVPFWDNSFSQLPQRQPELRQRHQRRHSRSFSLQRFASSASKNGPAMDWNSKAPTRVAG